MSVLGLPAAIPLAGGMAGSGMAGGMGGMGGAMGIVPLVAVLALTALVVAGAVGIWTVAGDSDERSGTKEPAENAVERLQRRYAEGELTESEFERALERELGSDGTTEAGMEPVGEPNPTTETKRAR
ncbi:SHOCT domain-containing protein [Halorubrum sp. RMP-47]|uniref:SHOCT domain-containing protein n=1 Tax=Halorubrum miltondacostae TaxID=3076378 RepID=A0ABD5M3J1_9EURY